MLERLFICCEKLTQAIKESQDYLKSLSKKTKILFLGSSDSVVCQRLQSLCSIQIWQEALTSNNSLIDECDLAVSLGFRHILKPCILKRFKRPVINLHISYLPWNRGADPNFWSFLEKTPSGVTIHQMDQGIDTGPIYAQAQVDQDLKTGTLATSYEKLIKEIEKLFLKILPKICSEEIEPKTQVSGGSFHKSKDKQKYLKLLHSGWNTPLRDIWGAACDTK